jgi:hypothetical protein
MDKKKKELILSILILIVVLYLVFKKDDTKEQYRSDPRSKECLESLQNYYDTDMKGPGLSSKLLESVLNDCGPDQLLRVPDDPTNDIRGGMNVRASEISNLSFPGWCKSIQGSNVTKWGRYVCNPHN